MTDKRRESTLERDASAYARARGWWETKLEAGNKDGLPDRLYIRRGVHLFIEFKRPDGDGTISSSQHREARKIRNAGGIVVFCEDMEHAKNLLY